MAEKMMREEERLMNKDEDRRKRKKRKIETGKKRKDWEDRKKCLKVKRVEQVV
jgi:hypothetical protein